MCAMAATSLVRLPSGEVALPPMPLYHNLTNTSFPSSLLCRNAIAYDAATDVLAGARGIQYAIDPHAGLLHPIEASMTYPYTLLGALQYREAHKRIKFFERIGDATGAHLAKADVVRSGLQAVWGASTIIERPLAFAAFVTNTDASVAAPSLLGRLSYVVGTAGNILLGLIYFISSVVSGYSLYKTLSWNHQMSKEFLSEQIEPTDVATIRKTAQELEEIALKQGSRWARQMLQAMDKEGVLENPKLTKDERRVLARRLLSTQEMIEALTEKYGIELWGECMEQTDNNVLQAFGLALSKEYADSAKRLEVERVLGKDLAKDVYEAANITDELIQKVKGALGWKKICTHVGMIILSLIGLTMMILTGIPTAICALVSSFMYATLSFICLFLDLPVLADYLKSGEVGKFDKTISIIGLTLGILIIAGLIASMVVVTGPTPFVILGLIGTTWMSVANGLILNKVIKNDLKHPTLHSLSERLQYNMGDELARKVVLGCKEEGYEGLPKDQLALIPYIFNKLGKSPASMTDGDRRRNVERMSEGELQHVVEQILALQEKQRKTCYERLRQVVQTHLPILA